MTTIDFTQPGSTLNHQIFAPYRPPFAPPAPYTVVPHALEVAPQANGRPDFLLELVRGINPLLPPTPYGRLDMALRPQNTLADALEEVRQHDPHATVTLPIFADGTLQFTFPGDIAAEIPPELLQPRPLRGQLGSARAAIKLSETGATFLKAALLDGALPVGAFAQMALAGVSPRIAVQATVDTAALHAALLALADAERRLSWRALVNFFRQPVEALPLTLAPHTAADQTLAEALADRVLAACGRLTPPPSTNLQPFLALDDWPMAAAVTWDLSQPLEVQRPFLLSLDPLAAARSLVTAVGLDAVYHESTVPPLSTGITTLTVDANLPDNIQGLLALGVNIVAPPDPPLRPQAISRSLILDPPRFRATTTLRFPPKTTPAFAYETFLVVQSSTGVSQLRGPVTAHTGDDLFLDVAAFPVRFLPLAATADLLAEANLTIRYTAGDGHTENHSLTAAQPALTFPLPEAAEATLSVEAVPLAAGVPLTLGPLPAQPLLLGRHSFPEFGSHFIPISCTLPAEMALAAFDFLPEGAAESEATTLAFTPAQPSREWRYLAASPFRAGYRYRPHTAEGLAEWSAVQPPFNPLLLTPKAVSGLA